MLQQQLTLQRVPNALKLRLPLLPVILPCPALPLPQGEAVAQPLPLCLALLQP